jgi:hypothetical protein
MTSPRNAPTPAFARLDNLGGGYREPVVDAEGQQLVGLYGGTHSALARDGRVFSFATTPVGKAIPLYTATDLLDVLLLWNPPNSGVDMEVIEYAAAYASGTSAYASVGLMVRSLAAIATGAALTALSDDTPFNGRVTGQRARVSAIRAQQDGQATVTAGVAGDWKRVVGSLNLEAQTGTAHGASNGIVAKLDGTLIVPPGYFIYPAATLASVALYAQHVVWAERPIPA